ncbi:uncharacterized protein LOC102300585 isoform X1 [Haplochromis burtoni]|uniref:uncharacterized protein LOC102300585 isoform X1 n=1 Tax=Haplochromis burtoni TaxID=8153 RepID=UPI0003BD6289|nr:uncharacterized protein LOC102300585 isoform X1 [Haplochromis burtoni]XP_005924027.1 uncharacterized protein LOC102300585 isoform X1 [Haplochromis burtoni]XP_005924031.2 uncharacterized protein LOC102300585 isoform X1 [Haplochromis burtoni]XP_014189591.1 uncharacterized protein LOC102300585 isoform X1 [Haplochromis burtoni]XP_042077493.1 uncharacterized protein LOC102300585 isoform X1 [Haplochromis burtoni]
MGSNSSKRLRQKTFEGPKRPEQRKEFPSAVTLVQPHPSEEKLFKELQQVGLNYDWLLQGHQSPEAEKVLQPPPNIPQVKTQEEKGTQTDEGSLLKESPEEKGTQTDEGSLLKESPEEKGTQTDEGSHLKEPPVATWSTAEKQSSGREFVDGIKAVWTPGELYGLLRDAPDAIKTPSDFHRWLRFTCMVYQPSPAELKKLLKLVYNYKWENVKEHFDLPGVDGEARWRRTRDMTAWLDTQCATSIKNAAWNDPEFVPPWLILQKPGESVTDFTERFHRLWNSTMSEANAFLFNLHLVDKLQPHVAKLLKDHVEWETFTFSKIKFILENMELKGTFTSKHQPSVTHPGEWRSDLLALPEPPRSSQTRRNKKKDRCFYCSKFGHWARECRARRQYSLEYSSQWIVFE